MKIIVNKGFTLVEVTLVVSLILGLVTAVSVGAQALRTGAERSRCIMNQATFTKSIESLRIAEDKAVGDDVGQPLAVALIASKHSDGSGVTCPSTGQVYPGLLATTYPKYGEVAICSTHTPKDHRSYTESGNGDLGSGQQESVEEGGNGDLGNGQIGITEGGNGDLGSGQREVIDEGGNGDLGNL